MPRTYEVTRQGTKGVNMSLLKAIEKVLKSAQRPLHVNEIYEVITEQDLWRSSGKTPTATIGALLYSDIKKRGDASLFERVAPHTFAMRDIVEEDSENQTTDSGTKDGEDQIPATDTVEQASLLPNEPVASMSFTDSAQKVLEEFGGKNPMHYRDITSKALAKGWLQTKGKTPEASMYAQVITEIKRRQNRGEPPRFVQHGRGFVGLSQWQARGLSFQIQQYNKKVRKNLRERLLEMEPKEFEELISQLLAEMGFVEVELVTKSGKDGGIDVRGILVVDDVVRIKLAVQVKRWKHNVRSPVVQQVRGSLGAHEQGLIVTTSDFSAGAKEEAEQSDKTPIALMNGEQLVLLLMEHGIGVHRSTSELYEIDEDSLVRDKDNGA